MIDVIDEVQNCADSVPNLESKRAVSPKKIQIFAFFGIKKCGIIEKAHFCPENKQKRPSWGQKSKLKVPEVRYQKGDLYYG